MNPEQRSFQEVVGEAQEKGSQRREQLLKRMDTVLGADVLVKGGMEILDQKRKAKVEEIKVKGAEIKKSIEEAPGKLANWAETKKDEAVDAFNAKKTEISDRAKAVGEDLERRAKSKGIDIGQWLTDRVYSVSEVPANLLSWQVSRAEAGSKKREDKLIKEYRKMGAADEAMARRWMQESQDARQAGMGGGGSGSEVVGVKGVVKKAEAAREKVASMIDKQADFEVKRSAIMAFRAGLEALRPTR